MPFTTPAAEDLYGISREVLANDFAPLLANVHPDDLPRVSEVLSEAARTMSRWHDEFRYQHPTKGMRWIEGWSVPTAEPDGGILWHGYVMDVTERKRAEEALREADRRKTEFLGVLSHELRNPLAPIRNSALPPRPRRARQRAGAHARRTHPPADRAPLAARRRPARRDAHLARARSSSSAARVDLREVVRGRAEDHRALFA